MDVFEQAFAFVVSHEGGYTAASCDPGNWTGGRCGAGECRGAQLCAEFQVRRLAFMAGLPTWRTFGPGWNHRLCALPFQAMQMGAQA